VAQLRLLHVCANPPGGCRVGHAQGTSLSMPPNTKLHACTAPLVPPVSPHLVVCALPQPGAGPADDLRPTLHIHNSTRGGTTVSGASPVPKKKVHASYGCTPPSLQAAQALPDIVHNTSG
jgi:hypothetical protein